MTPSNFAKNHQASKSWKRKKGTAFFLAKNLIGSVLFAFLVDEEGDSTKAYQNHFPKNPTRQAGTETDRNWDWNMTGRRVNK